MPAGLTRPPPQAGTVWKGPAYRPDRKRRGAAGKRPGHGGQLGEAARRGQEWRLEKGQSAQLLRARPSTAGQSANPHTTLPGRGLYHGTAPAGTLSRGSTPQTPCSLPRGETALAQRAGQGGQAVCVIRPGLRPSPRRQWQPQACHSRARRQSAPSAWRSPRVALPKILLISKICPPGTCRAPGRVGRSSK